ncbi:hypothetical protein BU24DRAFT_157475 [Aaosphaeria arxii CBS 175.79]|uniref:Uncharacterized protein n=1 Tax=Aaosphaeria arxii CBS 175.79 TaxID=1450172 RepID=A0A6A5XXQ2_9PLEO|nr:uncharacterized protein BU24DRAFT_157475 [Aaosphaeria arxii CBS 175.79]KAF2017736.1 hypothetical protein BU24DRAFT_157475 [Aaosphaeria arxii CBS 175.79]
MDVGCSSNVNPILPVLYLPRCATKVPLRVVALGICSSSILLVRRSRFSRYHNLLALISCHQFVLYISYPFSIHGVFYHPDHSRLHEHLILKLLSSVSFLLYSKNDPKKSLSYYHTWLCYGSDQGQDAVLKVFELKK